MIKLKKIDLKKRYSKEGPQSHHHPDIDGRKWYLAQINGQFYTGRFHKQWYGWNFTPPLCITCGFQLGGPSDWQSLWEIKHA